MDKDERIQRLKSIEGHVRGIQRMLESDSYCIDLVKQIHAVQAALGKLSASIIDDHLHSCLISAVRGDDPAERERVLEEIVDVYQLASKI